MAYMPYRDQIMKMTMHIDEDVLAEVVKITGVESKTKAVETALTEMVRRHKLKASLSKGLGLTSEELKNAWEDPFPEETARAAETPVKYGRKSARR
jgi:Arc/MetJ family transcription regulator